MQGKGLKLMDGEQRRKEIIDCIIQSKCPVSREQSLPEAFMSAGQVIVQDIALLQGCGL